MKQLSTILLILFSFQGFSQEEVEWFQPGQEWYYNVYCFQDYACGAVHYTVGETELIDGEEAAVLTRTENDEILEEPQVSSEYLRYANDTVWRYSTVAEAWHFLYDMGAEPGDVWTIQEDVFYGYSFDGNEPEEIPLFKVLVDSVVVWVDIPDSPLSQRRVVYTSPVLNDAEESWYTFGPILEGIGPVGIAHDLIGNEAGVALPLQSPSFQCFLDNGDLAYGSSGSPCFTLGTNDIKQLESGLVYPNPASESIFWNKPIDELRVFDALGKLVLQTGKAINQVSVSELERGFYTVVLIREGKSFSQKLLINR